MCACLVGSADELHIGAKSAKDAFKDAGVVELLEAVVRQDAPKAKRLIASGVNINAMGEGGVTPLLWVFGAHDLKAMKMLLELGADPDKYALGKVGEVDWVHRRGSRLEGGKRRHYNFSLTTVPIQIWFLEIKAC